MNEEQIATVSDAHAEPRQRLKRNLPDFSWENTDAARTDDHFTLTATTPRSGLVHALVPVAETQT